MLVIISDLHLTDGSSGETIREGAFRVLKQRLDDLIFDASWRGPKYKPIEEMDLVLLGDILDVIRSSRWLTEGDGLRPWDKEAPEFAPMVAAINERILEQNKASLEILRGISRGDLEKGSLSVPESYDGGASKKRLPVRVRIHYMVGNHDWFYHLPGAAFDAIRARVVEAIGLSNHPDEPFPHDLDETTKTAGALRELFNHHGVFARHGDIYDPFNYEGDRDASSLGDAIVVDLLNRFPVEVENQLSDRLPRKTLLGFREIDNVRPYTVIPGWLNGLLDRTVLDPGVKKDVKKIWDRLAEEFLASKFVRDRDRPWRWDLVDSLEAGIRIADGFSLEKLGKVAIKAYEALKRDGRSLSGNAFAEEACQKCTARFVVYGHTHRHEVVPLAARLDGDRLVRQLYVNSGTWRRVHEIVRHDLKSLQFYDFNVMTYLAFFHGDERGGRPWDSWSGTLGVV